MKINQILVDKATVNSKGPRVVEIKDLVDFETKKILGTKITVILMNNGYEFNRVDIKFNGVDKEKMTELIEKDVYFPDLQLKQYKNSSTKFNEMDLVGEATQIKLAK